ncbi:hypothetical protein PIB30_072635 [Stylosanthes scabra]|uniref:Uncharacterized protein n=1 Tax=Stylosanthes scabra TaxID=79078 RepID=A0ABU6SQ29_9FABA|nr:hypothetical protein [Stylosanthes scabra]
MIPYLFGRVKTTKLKMNARSGGITEPSDDLMIFAIPFFESISKRSRSFNKILNRTFNIPAHISSQFMPFEKTSHGLNPMSVVGTVEDDRYRTRREEGDDRRVECTRAREAHAQRNKRRVRAREEEFDDAVFGRKLFGGRRRRTQWAKPRMLTKLGKSTGPKGERSAH